MVTNRIRANYFANYFCVDTLRINPAEPPPYIPTILCYNFEKVALLLESEHRELADLITVGIRNSSSISSIVRELKRIRYLREI